jgi:hypothetical protein
MLRELMRFKPNLRRAALLACLGILLAGARVPAEDIPVPTNLSLLKSLTRQALTDILDSLDVRSDEPIYVQAAAHHETNWLVAESLADLLRRRGFRPVILEDGSAGMIPATQPQEDQTVEDPEKDASGDEEESGEVEEGDGVEDDPFDEDNEGDGFGDEEEDDEDGEDDEDDLNDEDEFGEGEDDEDILGDGDDAGDAEPAVGEDSEGTSPGGVTRPEPLTPEAAPATPTPAPQRKKARLDGDVLRFRVLELGVTYPKSKRALLLLGPKSITRLTGAHLRVTHVSEPEGAVRGVADSERHSIDRFPGSVRAYVEGANYPFTRPEMKPAPWGKLVEPAVVLGIVSGLVYLFYANQS